MGQSVVYQILYKTPILSLYTANINHSTVLHFISATLYMNTKISSDVLPNSKLRILVH